jgi:hypothetical protein
MPISPFPETTPVALNASEASQPQTQEAEAPSSQFGRTHWILLGALLTIAGAIFNGTYLGRWSSPFEFGPLVDRVNNLPNQLGSWQFVQAGEELRPEVIDELQVRGYASRFYKHPVDDRIAQVLIMLGNTGPMLTHPPEICYTRSGKVLQETPKQIDIPDGGALKTLQFGSTNPAEPNFTVMYGFYDGSRWIVPAGRVTDRWRWGGLPYLYKLQVVSADEPKSFEEQPEAVIELVRELQYYLDHGPDKQPPVSAVSAETR